MTYNYVLRFLMEIYSKIHVEQPAPHGVHRHRQMSVTDKQTDKNSTFSVAPAAGEIRAPPNQAC